jgi:hypothetical protein
VRPSAVLRMPRTTESDKFDNVALAEALHFFIGDLGDPFDFRRHVGEGRHTGPVSGFSWEPESALNSWPYPRC